ncbi:MAG: hypothetical protein V8S27_07730 [Lachnospiraceae bacterium]
MLVGPDSYVTEDRKDYKVTKSHLDGLFADGSRMFKQMKQRVFYSQLCRNPLEAV